MDSMASEYDLHLPHRKSLQNSRVPISMNKSSHVTKTKPKIRIIHIFAPEIIKTDVKNFRALVQSLTGKHAVEAAKSGRRRTKPENPVITNQDSTGDHDQVNRLAGFSGTLLASSSVKTERPLGEFSDPNVDFDLEGLIDLEDGFSTFHMKPSHHMDHGFMLNNASDQTKGHHLP
ncbi:PREDICTED: VQ motif-containing protein 18-like isoform X2 [Tarenaya hassleriana]|uniref:VQ motif-containing protein 18-like isoform X2 n=1 Tax=Tarenaya hassleriana TaxID=28532 RepID=UPI00053C8145|nr:PREDICTED: VQ motif-containing protein 18-like isoform X2 [Tarenaya hassleriana]